MAQQTRVGTGGTAIHGPLDEVQKSAVPARQAFTHPGSCMLHGHRRPEERRQVSAVTTEHPEVVEHSAREPPCRSPGTGSHAPTSARSVPHRRGRADRRGEPGAPRRPPRVASARARRCPITRPGAPPASRRCPRGRAPHVARAVVLDEALAEEGQRDRHVGEDHDVVAVHGLLAPRDALGVDAGPAQAPEDRVVRRDLDRRHVRAGFRAPQRRHAGRGDLDEVLRHPAAQEDRAVPGPGAM